MQKHLAMVSMKNLSVFLSISAVFLLSSAAFGGTRKESASFPAQYQGGTAPLKQNHGVKAVVAGDTVVLVQHGQRISVPVESISEISCATDVRRRFGATVLGLVPLMDLDKIQTHYVGLAWSDNSQTGTNHQVLLKLTASEYRDLVGTLERLTGKQAVDTKKTPTVVHYDL